MNPQLNNTDNDFGFWGNPKTLLTLVLIWLVILVCFRTYPQVDLAVAYYFYDPEICAEAKKYCLGFPYGKDETLKTVRDTLHASPEYIGFGLLAYIIWRFLRGIHWHNSKSLRNQILVLVTLVLGPLLIVNAFFKEFFGRVRPRHIEEFGGQFDFTRAGDIAGQCMGNCSFVSGEASIGGWFFVCGLLFAQRFRNKAYLLLGALGGFMALLRVSFGAHFLSDAILGYLVPPIICAVVALLITQLQKLPIDTKA